jgi:poly-gamma-glutamate capsule biosynthesis protein CapA/YwtB (metallophosphatase superfamily)
MAHALTMALTGDVLPTRRLLADGRPVCPASEPALDLLRSADVTIGNFEMPLTRHSEPKEKILNIRAEPEVAEDIPMLGFNCLTVANNHSVDYGWQGLTDTMTALRSAGVQTIGAGETLEEAARPAIIEVNGFRIGVVAFSCLLPAGSAAAPDRAGLSPIHIETSYEINSYYQMEEPGEPAVVNVRTRVRKQDQAFAEQCIRQCRAEVDFLVASIHWGYGSSELLADYQQPLGRALIDAGANIVHGHHPHAVHAAEFYDGKAILYSLGTLIGQQTFLDASEQVKQLWSEMSPDGYVALLDIEDDGSYRLHAKPTTLNADRLPERATGTAFERVSERLHRLSLPHQADVIGGPDGLEISPLRCNN